MQIVASKSGGERSVRGPRERTGISETATFDSIFSGLFAPTEGFLTRHP